MKFVNQLLENDIFIQAQKEIRDCEKGRIYCYHEIQHALDVCRIAWILYLEEHLDQSDVTEMKEQIYVTGLLHDIGRGRQYLTGEHHSIAGVALAETILKSIGYPENLMEETISIIGEHHGRQEKQRTKDTIGYYIEKADHLSRNCFCCEAVETCKWKKEERNKTITT